MNGLVKTEGTESSTGMRETPYEPPQERSDNAPSDPSFFVYAFRLTVSLLFGASCGAILGFISTKTVFQSPFGMGYADGFILIFAVIGAGIGFNLEKDRLGRFRTPKAARISNRSSIAFRLGRFAGRVFATDVSEHI